MIFAIIDKVVTYIYVVHIMYNILECSLSSTPVLQKNPVLVEVIQFICNIADYDVGAFEGDKRFTLDV